MVRLRFVRVNQVNVYKDKTATINKRKSSICISVEIAAAMVQNVMKNLSTVWSS